MRCTMYRWRITLSNALLWRFWEDPAVSSLGETRTGAETFLSGRNAIYALKKGAFQPGLLATYYTFNQGGILEIQKFRCVSVKVFRKFGLLPRSPCVMFCPEVVPFKISPTALRMSLGWMPRWTTRPNRSEFNRQIRRCFVSLTALGHPKSLVRLHIFRPLCCSMEGLCSVGHSIYAAISAISTMLWEE